MEYSCVARGSVLRRVIFFLRIVNSGEERKIRKKNVQILVFFLQGFFPFL